MDLEVAHPHSTIMVDDPVDVSGMATIKPGFMLKVKDIIINFQYAQAYPPAQRENGVVISGTFHLNKAQDNKFIGAREIYWPIEGHYIPTLQVNFEDMPPTDEYQYNEAAITVYPKSEWAQIVTNEAIIALAIASYGVGVAALLNVIYQLWYGS